MKRALLALLLSGCATLQGGGGPAMPMLGTETYVAATRSRLSFIPGSAAVDTGWSSNGTTTTTALIVALTADTSQLQFSAGNTFPIRFGAGGGSSSGIRWDSSGVLDFQIGGAVNFRLGMSPGSVAYSPNGIWTLGRFQTSYGLKIGDPSTATDQIVAATPTLTGFGGTGASISGTSFSFRINVGTVAPGGSGTITFPTTQSLGWNCRCDNVTHPDDSVISQSGAGTTTTCPIKNYARTTGLAANWAASDVLSCHALGWSNP